MTRLLQYLGTAATLLLLLAGSLNAADEPSSVVDLLIVAGQSNAVGYDAKPTELPADDVDQQILFWWRCGDPPPDQHDSTCGGQWARLQPQPLGAPKKPREGRQYGNFAQPEGGFGPEIGLARTIAAKGNTRLAVVKAAFSGTALKRDWNPADPGEGGSCYRSLIEETRAAIAAAKQDGVQLRPRAFVWVQGESDANAEHAPHYADNLGAMLAALRRDIDAPKLPALIAVNTKFGNGRNEFMPLIVEQQKLLASRDRLCEYVDTSAATIANGAHYNTQGTLDVGRWFAEALLRFEAQPTATVERTRQKLLAGQPVRVVCFGDSVTGVYYHTGSRRAYTDMLGIALRKSVDNAQVEMINAGISGHTTVNALTRIDKDVLSHEPDLVTVMFGLNDMVRVPLDDYRANLKTIVAKCREIGAEVVLATPNNVVTSSGRPTEKLITYCEVVREVGRELSVPVCDCYREMDGLRARNEFAWRLLMSDAIHPNMDGHKVMAELLAHTISGCNVSLADADPLPPLGHLKAKLAEGKPLRVLAMSPIAETLPQALKAAAPDVQAELTVWPTHGLSLPELEADAQKRVRALKPDLVVIAVPRSASVENKEAFAKSFAWVMNWSLNFGSPTWDCVVVHPAVFEADSDTGPHDDLVRQLVRAQDLTLIDRAKGDAVSGEDILSRWLQSQIKAGVVEGSAQ
jgi:lysophospholipase L1-like esterase